MNMHRDAHEFELNHTIVKWRNECNNLSLAAPLNKCSSLSLVNCQYVVPNSTNFTCVAKSQKCEKRKFA